MTLFSFLKFLHLLWEDSWGSGNCWKNAALWPRFSELLIGMNWNTYKFGIYSTRKRWTEEVNQIWWIFDQYYLLNIIREKAAGESLWSDWMKATRELSAGLRYRHIRASAIACLLMSWRSSLFDQQNVSIFCFVQRWDIKFVADESGWYRVQTFLNRERFFICPDPWDKEIYYWVLIIHLLFDIRWLMFIYDNGTAACIGLYFRTFENV